MTTVTTSQAQRSKHKLMTRQHQQHSRKYSLTDTSYCPAFSRHHHTRLFYCHPRGSLWHFVLPNSTAAWPTGHMTARLVPRTWHVPPGKHLVDNRRRVVFVFACCAGPEPEPGLEPEPVKNLEPEPLWSLSGSASLVRNICTSNWPPVQAVCKIWWQLVTDLGYNRSTM